MTLPQRLEMRGAVVIVFLAVSLAGMSARQASSGAVSIDNDDLGGVVSGPRGPEAGVWVFPIETRGLSTGVYDPKTKQFTPINTCFGTHHLNFANDADNTLWFCGGGQVVGWFNTKVYDETKNAEKAQGWTVLVLDTNGNGKRDAYVEPDQPVDPTKDKRISAPYYGVSISPDGAVWGSSTGYPGSVVRMTPGRNPPATALAEYYELPLNAAGEADKGFSPRGFDVDGNGVAWLALSSGHLASFDRRKCKGPLNGPKATGQHCQEGWTTYPLSVPQVKGVTASGSAEAPYYAHLAGLTRRTRSDP